MSIRVGIDTGGTFTDLVAVDPSCSRWYRSKVPSTPAEPLMAIANAFDAAGIDPCRVEQLILGTTVGTNALLERKGAKVAYITTEGFEDIPFIQRGNRRFHYDLHWRKPKPFIERRDCIGVPERMDYRGTPITVLDTDALGALAKHLERVQHDCGLDAVAVNLLFSYLNPSHELALEGWLAEKFPQLAVSSSHRVAPVWREYERGITTIADAYLKPLLQRFLANIGEGLQSRGFDGSWSLVKSNGGTRLAVEAAREPIHLLLSGLVGGVMAGKHFGGEIASDLITLDMGGTSCDLAVITRGEQRYAAQFDVEFGLPIVVPTIDVNTIGAGGGSVAWIDRGGFLRVGPQSAGAEPGPACYGRGGTEPTVTDANLLLGRLDPDYFLGGTVRLDSDSARRAVSTLAAGMQLSSEEAALAIIDIANENMVNAVRVRTVEIGIDPRAYCLVAFGGAGALHASAIAQRLGITRILVPPHPGLCSAYGALTADLRSDQIATVFLRSSTVQVSHVRAYLERLAALACRELEAERFTGDPAITAKLAMRYAGQNYEHEVTLPTLHINDSDLQNAFHEFEVLHERFYGYQLGGEVIEIINVTVTAVGAAGLSVPGFEAAGDIRPGHSRPVRFRTEHDITVPVYHRDSLLPGWTGVGPMIIEDADATTLIEPGGRVTALASGALSIEIGKKHK
jgi:N-methylhydantoinase A